MGAVGFYSEPSKAQIQELISSLDISQDSKCEICFNMALKWLEAGEVFFPSGFSPSANMKLVSAKAAISMARRVVAND